MSQHRYFQGRSVLGPVTGSKFQTFREVVDLFRLPATLGLTREAFLALDKEKRNEIKQVGFLVPAVFSESPSKRVTENAVECNLLFLDIDPEIKLEKGKWVETGHYPAAPFFHNPDTLYSALDGFNFAAYITASSTPQKPRMRIVVDAQSIPLSHYTGAVETVAKFLGLTQITKESKIAVQPMFLPTQFSDSTDEDHPLIAHRTDARAFTVKNIRVSVNGFSLNGHNHNGVSHGDDALFFLRAPLPEITLAIASEALDAIDPDCGYLEWLECAAALKHQFFPHKEEEAFKLFDDWSARGTKYGSEEETRAKWASLRPTPVGRVPVTIRSLLRLAVASGWDDKKIKENSFRLLVQWTEEVDSVTTLMEKGVQKILSAPLLSAIHEDALVHQICTQAKKRFAYTISPTAVRKDLLRCKAQIKALEKPAEKVREPNWAKGVCYVASAQDFFRSRTGEKYKMEAFNASYGRWLLPTEDSLKEAGLPVTPATLAKPIVSPSDYALNHLKILTVYDYAYDPAQPTEMIFVHQGKRFVNTYTPTYPELDPANAETAGKLFCQHLERLVAEPEYQRVLLDFFAYHVQFPGRKVRWAPCIQSVEGAGKTFLAETAKAVLGANHVKTISGEAIKKGWNEWSFGSQLLVFEEIRVVGTNKFEIMNTLKPLITNGDISINQRNRDTREVANCTNYMLFSNHHDALALSPGDRRYFVIKSPLQTKKQVLELGENYFPPLYAMLRDHAGGLRAWFDQWAISADFNPDGHAPRTKYLSEMVEDSANEAVATVRRLLLEGDYPLVQYDIVSSAAILNILHVEEGVHKVNAQYVTHILREEGFLSCGRITIGEERHYIWARAGIDPETAIQTAVERETTGAKNLCMELLF